MPKAYNRILASLLALTVIVFALLARPNAAGSENMAMVLMFQPDEAAPLPYVLQMIAPNETLEKSLRAFLFYGYYYYGFPYFALSALSILPLQLLGKIDDLPLVMLTLRQVISVLPMIAGLLLLVYLHDGFRSYRSPVVYALLLSVPAVLSNNLWWHPDGLIVLLTALTLFFLHRDNLRFGLNFLAAAVVVGVMTATKLVGLYFFLAIGLTLLLGLVQKRLSWKRLAGMSLAFLLVMGISFLVSNPFLLSHWARTEYIWTLNKQLDLVSEGYGVVYERGLAAAWPIMHEHYGEAIFLLAALGAAAWGAWRGPRRLLCGLTLAWFAPLTISLLTVTHFKIQYWLPVALPLIACIGGLLPERLSLSWRSFKPQAGQYALLGLLLAQFALFLFADFSHYDQSLHRVERSERIAFYDQSVNALQPLDGTPILVYYDYRLYVPDTPNWSVETSFDLLSYQYIEERNFDVLLLLEQRIRDYLHEDAQGIDPEQFALNQAFYRDADNETVRGYQLIYRDPVGLVYVRDDLFQNYAFRKP